MNRSLQFVVGLFVCGVCALPALAGGTLSLSPNTAPANSDQVLTFTYTVGPGGIQATGGIQIEFIPSGGQLSPFFNKNQNLDPTVKGYTRAWTDGAATVDLIITRSGREITVAVQSGFLLAGQHIFVEYNGEVPHIVQSMTWHVRERADGDDPWEHMPDERSDTWISQPLAAAEVLLVAPADVSIGEGFDLAVVVMDPFLNRAEGFRGTVRFTSTDPQAELPGAYTFTAGDAGVHVFENVRFRTQGFQQIVPLVTPSLGTHTHWTRVWNSTPPARHYFGETHFHTGTGALNQGFDGHSGDHRGNYTRQEDAYKYVRDVMRLDFASASEHDNPSLSRTGWEKSQQLATQFNDPGKFTTFYAYEWTSDHFAPGGGQRIVLYKQSGKGLFRATDSGSTTITGLWQNLDAQGAPVLTIPHIQFPEAENKIWDHHHSGYERVGEIFSKWNNSNGYTRQSFELGKNNKWSYQHAWSKGFKLGVLGSTDNHYGQPGLNDYSPYTGHNGGLAVALAGANTRNSLWDAFQRRRTYATTGTRIYIDFRLNGIETMGAEIVHTDPRRGPLGELWIAGTDKIVKVEAVKYDGGNFINITLPDDDPHPELFHFRGRDPNFTRDSMYYFRVTQQDGEMAWTSPVWVRHSASMILREGFDVTPSEVTDEDPEPLEYGNSLHGHSH